MVQQHAPMPRIPSDADGRVPALDFGAIEDDEPCLHLRYVVDSSDDDIVGAPLLEELPWSLKQLEELFNDCNLLGLRNDSNHSAPRTGHALAASCEEFANALDHIA